MGLLGRFRRSAEPGPTSAARSSLPLSLHDYAELFKFGAHWYGVAGLHQTLPGQKQEPIEQTFSGLVGRAFKQNGVVFSCLMVRMLLFSEARFTFRRLRGGRTGDTFGTAALELLERPWPNATTGDLLARMEQDSSLAGNAFVVRRGGQLRRLRPDWVTIVAGSPSDADADLADIDAEVVGYLYHPGGRYSGRAPVPLNVEDVAHYAPMPDPEFRFRGMSWLTPVITEIMGDQAASSHKLAFFENGATVNLAIKFDKEVVKTLAQFEEWRDAIESTHAGVGNAYKTLYLAGGADPVPIGSDLKQLDFKVTQGAGETRIAAASGVPAVLVGLSEGLLSASQYANFSQARRRLADGTLRPLWRNVAGSLATIIEVPSGAELWYDTSDIAFLREDEEANAVIVREQATSIRTLVDGGYDPDSVVAAVTAGDLSLLEHSGLTSVQLLPPGTTSGGNGGGNGEGEASARDVLSALARGKEG